MQLSPTGAAAEVKSFGALFSVHSQGKIKYNKFWPRKTASASKGKEHKTVIFPHLSIGWEGDKGMSWGAVAGLVFVKALVEEN